MASAPDRLAWLDHARAVGIVLVVLGHAIRSVDRTGLATPPALMVLDTAIYSFHMPLFFLLAGMTQTIGGGRTAGAALKAAFWGIALPYLVWSAVWFALKSGFAGAANQAVSAPLVSVLWSPVDHFWFLYVLLLLRLVWIVVDATGSALVRRLAVMLPLAAAFVGAGPSDGIFNAFLLFWAAFYGLGVLVGPSPGGLSRPALAAGGAVALAVWVAMVWSDPALTAGGFGPLRTLAALAGSAALIAAIALAAPRGRVGRLLGFLGEASLTVFLTHTLFGAAVRLALARTGLLSPGTLVAAATVAGVVGPLLLHAGVLRVGLATGLPVARWVGLGTQRRSHWLDLGPRPAPAVSLGDRAS